jgi:hypothetical protein
MLETLDKLMLAGRGAARAPRTGFVKEVMDSADRTRAEFQRLVADQVRQTVNNLHLATKDDLLRIELKLDQLLAKNTVET